MIRSALLLVAASLATAADGERDAAAALTGRVPGAPVQCLSNDRASTPQIFGNRILLYRDGNRLWRNDLPEACPGLERDPIIVTEVHGGQICRNDTFSTLERGGLAIPGPHCRLGEFVPWERAKR